MSAENGEAVHRPALTEFDEFAVGLQQKAENHLNDCLAAMDDIDAGEEIENPAYAPFDGCNTCIVREVLMCCLDEVVAYVKQHPDEFTD